MRSRSGWLGVLLFTGLTISCGGGGATGPSGGNTSPPPPGAAPVADVTIQDFSFSPANVTIKVGQTVRWTNSGPSQHTTTSDAGVWDSGPLSAPGGGGGYGGGSGSGGSFQFAFAQAGTFSYHCSIHPPSQYPGFVGTVTVNP